MSHPLSRRGRAASFLIALVASASTCASWAATPVLQPSQTIDAPADPGPILHPAMIGFGISIDRDKLLLGSSNGTPRGFLYRNDGDGNWEHYATLVIPDEDFHYRQGILHGDTAVITTLYAYLDTLIGRVYVFHRSNGSWSLIQTIDESADAPGSLVDATLAFDGRTMVIGSGQSGAAFVYSQTLAGTFALTATLRETPQGTNPIGYGVSVAVDGRALAVGAVATDGATGSVYVYRLMGDTWQNTQLLSATDPNSGAEFGAGLVMSNGTLLVSAPYADPDPTGDVPTIHGAAYAFVQNPFGQWVDEEKIANPTNGSFAGNLAVDGGRAVIVASYIRPHDDDPYGTPLAFARAFVYDRSGGNWALTAALEGFQSSNNFGLGVAVQGRHPFVGDPTVQTPDPLFDGQVYEFTVPRPQNP